MADAVPFGSEPYYLFLLVLTFSRAMDFFSTWLATPNLVLEANPIARKLGWRWAIPLNLALCLGFATWPLPAVILSTTSLMVAARNFQSAWIMRTMGEQAYRLWLRERLIEAAPGLFLFCLFAQVLLVGSIGVVLIWFASGSGLPLIPLGIGAGLVAYALAVLIYSLISVWRSRRSSR